MTTLKLPGLDYDTAELEDFCKRWSVVKLAVFGPAARNELQDSSEVDVMVTLEPNSPVSAWAFIGLQDELAQLLHRPVHLVEEGVIASPLRLEAIERDLTVFYAA
jgi:predicted nucleotidyltransferase